MRTLRVFEALFQLFYLVESSSHNKLPDRPLNLAVTAGQRVQMTCEPDNRNISNTSKISEWIIQRPFSNSRRSLWTNWKDASRIRNSTFDIEDDGNGSVTISSNSIRLEDAGIYTCLIDRSPKQPERSSAQLIVLESDPQCSTNLTDGSITEFNYVAFRCAVNYSGHWTPSMQWSINGNALNKESSVANFNISHDVQQLSSVINFQVNAEDDGATITCETFFIETEENANKTSAINVPEYKFYCNRTLAILFGPRNVTITPKKDVYHWQDVLNCKAAGEPSPLYTWRNVRTEEKIADGPQLALNEAGLKDNGRHVIECIAQNQVSGEIKLSSATIDIVVTGISMITILTGIICVILLLIVIIIGRKHIKGWIGKLSSVFQRRPANEPDILPNDDDIQNSVASNNELEPYGHYAVPAEMVAVGNVRRLRDENAAGNHDKDAKGSAANQFDETMDVKFPVYAEINKPKNDGACNTYSRGVAANTSKSTKTSVGRDGTVYAEVNIDGGLHQSEASVKMSQNPMFNKSEYARIDHTDEPPPRPPKRK